MSRLITFVMAVVFCAAQCVAAPMATCRHADSAAHDAARASGEAAIAAGAHHEEIAAASAEKQGSLADQGASGLTHMLMPVRPSLAAPLDKARRSWRPGRTASFSGRTLNPLLRPPSA